MTDDRELLPDGARPSAYVLRVGGADQSHVDLDDPTYLAFDYVRRIGDVLDAIEPAGEPLRVVHVGGAGMTLARYVAATRPRSSQVVLEPDESLTAFVREHLPLPRRSGIKVRGVDGRSGLAAFPDDSVDVVVVDAFAAARVPAELTTREALADVRRVLRGTGLVALNLADRAPFGYTRRVVAGLRAEVGDVLLSAEPGTLAGRRFGNVLAVASPAPLPVASLQRRAAGSPLPYRVLEGHAVDDRVGKGVPFTDADAEASPPPPGGATYFA